MLYIILPATPLDASKGEIVTQPLLLSTLNLKGKVKKVDYFREENSMKKLEQ